MTDLPPLDPAPGAEPSSDQGRAPAPGERPGGGAATAKRVELLFREIVALAEERQVEELVERFAELRQLMDELGAEGTAEVRAKLGRYAKELEGLGEVRLSIQLQVYINEGNQLLREMAAAIREEELARVEGLFLKVEAVVGDMRDEEREVFHRNAEALLLRAQSLRERAAVLARAFEHPVELGAVLSRRPGTGEPNLALINGQVHQEGDPVRDAQGRETPVRVVAVSTSTVRLRFDDTEFVRALTD